MSTKLLLTAIVVIGVLSLSSGAVRADEPSLWIELVTVDNSAGYADPDFPEDVQTVDVIIHVEGDCFDVENDWYSATIESVINGATVYQHPLGPEYDPPSPDLFDEHPGLAFDTYVCTADLDLSDSATAAYHYYVTADTTHEFAIEWADMSYTGNGTFAIARISLLPCRVGAGWWPEFDLTDCRMTPLHYQIYLSPRPCPGDLDSDGDVDLTDLATLLASYGVDEGGDQDCDGDTDLADLADLLANYGCVPE